jgi:DNA-binding GntR family transcriptional regulator
VGVATDTIELPGIVPISRHTLHGELVERLRDMIIEGRLAPGSRINEGPLGSSLGVSRTPLREAIKFLASEGLIELVPGRGAVVKALTPRDVQEMLQVLTALEVMAGRLACRVATDAQVAGVRSLHDQMMGFYASRDRLEYYKRNQAIHTGIVALSGNRFLAGQHEAIQGRMKRIRFIGNEKPTGWAGAVAEHEDMIAALEARDADRLAAALTTHLERTWERVRDTLAIG